MHLKDAIRTLKWSEKLPSGKATSVEEFHDRVIAPRVNLEAVRRWHRVLLDYFAQSECTIFVRRCYKAAESGRRRHLYTRFADGFGFVFSDNSLAQKVFTMAANGYAPSLQDWCETVQTRALELDWYATGGDEKQFEAFPRGRSPRLNEQGWKLAHVFSLNEQDYDFDYAAHKNRLFPQGALTDWHRTLGYPCRTFSRSPTPDERGMMLAHAIRNIHPLNYFPVPLPKHEHGFDGKGSGEDLRVRAFHAEWLRARLPREFEEFSRLARVGRGANQGSTSSSVFSVTYGPHFEGGKARREGRPIGKPTLSKHAEEDFSTVNDSELCRRIHRVDLAPDCLDWTGNDDSGRNHNGAVRKSKVPCDLLLHWKSSKASERKPIGCYRLDLAGLLRGGYIRPDSKPGFVRVRLYHASDNLIYIQTNSDGPNLPLGRFT